MDNNPLSVLQGQGLFLASSPSPPHISASPSPTPPSPHDTEFAVSGLHGTMANPALSTSTGWPDLAEKKNVLDDGYAALSAPHTPETAVFPPMAPHTPSTPLPAAAAQEQAETPAKAIHPVDAIGQNAASFVSKGPHDGPPTHATATATATTREREANSRRKESQQEQQEQRPLKGQGQDQGTAPGIMNLDDEEPHDNAPSTPPSTSLNLDRCSITNTDVDMSMTSPARHSKSLPTSTSSSFSNGGRKIAESSMVLNLGTGTDTDPFSSQTITTTTTPTTTPTPTTPTSTPAVVTSEIEAASSAGSLSPACSMSSFPRDISASYSRDRQVLAEPTAIPLDERLYSLVDRYGFLVEEGRTPTADRNSARSSTLSSTRRSVRPSYESKRQAKLLAKEQERSRKWSKMARQYTSDAWETEYSFSHSSKFVSRIYKGIPDCWRAAAWSHLISKRSVDFDPNIRQAYEAMLAIPSPEEEQIDLDIPRTMHGHIMFRMRYGPGQCALFRVLKAYSNYNAQVGYCQGMASVVATMLTFFDEEKTFVLLAQMFERYNLNDLVVPGFPALFEAFYIQEELTKLYAPKVFQALTTMGIQTAGYASRWYITLFSAGVVPYRTLLRIWDIFLLEGFDWLYFVAIALLKYYEPMLVQHNFEQTMEMLNAKMDIQDDERLLKIAQKLFKQARQSGIVPRLRRTYAATLNESMEVDDVLMADVASVPADIAAP